MDNDEIDIEQVFKFLDVILNYRRNRLLEALLRDDHTDENLVKVEAAGELIGTTINSLVSKELRDNAEKRLNKALEDMVKSTYFRKESTNARGDGIFKRN